MNIPKIPDAPDTRHCVAIFPVSSGVSGIFGDAPTEHLGGDYRDREGRKDDDGKDGFEYLPDDALAGINRVLAFGAQKYAPRNWEKGMAWLRPWRACMRHLWAWVRREPCDPETGESHLLHAGCCILFLIAYEMRGVGTDNRLPAPTETPPPK